MCLYFCADLASAGSTVLDVYFYGSFDVLIALRVMFSEFYVGVPWVFGMWEKDSWHVMTHMTRLTPFPFSLWHRPSMRSRRISSAVNNTVNVRFASGLSVHFSRISRQEMMTKDITPT